MDAKESLKSFGFTKYEIDCYLALVNLNPVNRSRLSRVSKVPRSKIYDVLRNMEEKGLVAELEGGLYAPLPPEELVKRLKSNFKDNMEAFEDHIKQSEKKASYDYIWSIRDYREVLNKARDMINRAQKELYVRLDPKEGEFLDPELAKAVERGVALRYVALGKPKMKFDIQVVHPGSEDLANRVGGRALDIIADVSEALVGIFGLTDKDDTPVNWTRNHWFVVSSRDSVRHDFYHCFLHKLYDQNQDLSEKDKAIYELIQAED